MRTTLEARIDCWQILSGSLAAEAKQMDWILLLIQIITRLCNSLYMIFYEQRGTRLSNEQARFFCLKWLKYIIILHTNATMFSRLFFLFVLHPPFKRPFAHFLWSAMELRRSSTCKSDPGCIPISLTSDLNKSRISINHLAELAR
jgi:hypothetical protein